MMREGKVERKEKRAVSGRGSKPSPQEVKAPNHQIAFPSHGC